MEGHESEVLQGAVKTLSKLHPVVIIENWYKPETIMSDIKPLAYLEALGYRLFMASIALADDPVAIGSMKAAPCQQFGLSMIEFDHTQRAFFERHRNVIAIHSDQVASIGRNSVKKETL